MGAAEGEQGTNDDAEPGVPALEFDEAVCAGDDGIAVFPRETRGLCFDVGHLVTCSRSKRVYEVMSLLRRASPRRAKPSTSSLASMRRRAG